MAKIPSYDPLTSEVQSPLVAGLTEAMSSISETLDMRYEELVDYPLNEVYISPKDRYRIYQAPLGKKLWMAEPTPVIKRNGTVIKPDTDAFKLDLIGGSITFNIPGNRTDSDVFTVTCRHVIDGSTLGDKVIEAQANADQAKKISSDAVESATQAKTDAANSATEVKKVRDSIPATYDELTNDVAAFEREVVAEKKAATSKTKIAFEFNGNSVEIPTMDEFNQLSSEIDNSFKRLADGKASNIEVVGTPVYSNIYNQATDVIDGVWIGNDGVIHSLASSKSAKVNVDGYDYAYFSLGLAKKVSPHSGSMGGWLLLDSQGKKIGDVIKAEDCKDAEDYNGDYSFKIPIIKGAKYLFFTIKLATSWDATETASLRIIKSYENGKLKKIFGYGLYQDKKWADKKWVAFGDSLTENNLRTTMHYHDYIAEETGINVVNFGSSGTGYKRTEDENKAFYQRILNIPTDTDIITIFGSGNDLNYSAMGLSDFKTALGKITDTTTDTICGCINKTIDNLYTIIPTAQIGIITPTPWQAYNPSIDGNNMSLYSNALIEIAKRHGIPFLDLYHCSNLRPWDSNFRKLAYSKDDGGGTHPDETGHKLIAPRFKAFLETLLL